MNAPFERDQEWPTWGKMANTIGIKINYEPLAGPRRRRGCLVREGRTKGQTKSRGHKSSGQAVAPWVPRGGSASSLQLFTH